MRQRTRMFFTLSCLALSMTVVSTFLGWLNPGFQRLATASKNEAEVRRLAEDSVWRDVESFGAGWRRIKIEMEPSARSGIALAGLDAQNHGWHFQIDALGRTVSSQLWKEQLAVSGESSAIRIRVPYHRSADQVNPQLWLAVRTLVSTLGAILPNEGEPLTVSLPDRLDQLDGINLATLLASTQKTESAS